MQKNQRVTHTTHEKALSFLNRYQNLKVNIQKKKEKSMLLKSRASSTQMNLDSERVQTTPKDRMSELLVKAADLDAQIERDEKQLEEVKQKMIVFLSDLDDPREMNVLIMYHLEDKTFLQIADVIDRCERQVYRIYDKGVDHVAQML